MRVPMEYTHFGYKFNEWTDEVFHPGVDLNFGQDDLGLSVYACQKGTVEFTQKSDEGYGNMVVINHGSYFSKYAHLSEILVKVGDSVNYMSIIGKVGDTGHADGPHLHWELPKERQKNWNSYTYGMSKEQVAEKYLDPMVVSKPKVVRVAIVAINNAFARTSEFAKISNWFFRYTAGQLDLKFDVKKLGEPAKFQKKNIEDVDFKWLHTKVLPLANGYDVCALMIDKKEWTPKKREGVAYDKKHLGVQVICMKSDRDEKRSNSPSVGGDQATIGRLTHELCHAIFDMAGFPKENSVHYYDYELKQIEQALLIPNLDRLVGWKVDGKFRVFKKKGTDTIDRLLPISYKFDGSGYQKAGFTLQIP